MNFVDLKKTAKVCSLTNGVILDVLKKLTLIEGQKIRQSGNKKKTVIWDNIGKRLQHVTNQFYFELISNHKV